MKRLTTTLFSSILLVLPFVASAQNEENEQIQHIIADYERGKALSLAYVDAMPAEKFNYKPTDDVRTYAQQFLHASQGTIGLTANGTGADRLYADENLEKNEAYQSKEEVRRLVTESFDFAIESVRNMDPSTFEEIKEAGPFKVTKLGWIYKGFEHLVHHRGQAAVYLRMNGITPPQFQLF